MVIELGDKVKDLVTGVTGIVFSRVEFINGCIQYGIIQKIRSNGKLPEELNIDEQSLVVIKKGAGIVKEKVKKVEKKPTGGPISIGKKMRGY